MNKNQVVIFVASKEEADLLLSEDIDNIGPVFTVITGYGLGGTIREMSNFDKGTIAVNIGFVGIPSEMELHKLYSVNTSILGPNNNSINKPVIINTIDSLQQLPCITVNDFETDTDRFYPSTVYTKEYLIDMELYALANYFDTVYALKIPSDRGDMHDYENQHIHKQSLANIRNTIYNIIYNICGTDD